MTDATNTATAAAETPAAEETTQTPQAAETTQTTQTENTPERSASDTAAEMRAGYSFDAPAEPETQETPPAAETDAAPYALEFSDNFTPQDELLSVLTSKAQATGLSGREAGAYTEAVISALQEQEYANMVQTDAELKRDWGSRYADNKKDVVRFAEDIRQRAGLTREDMAVLQSPKGFRFLHALMEATNGSQQAAGLERSAPSVGSSYAEAVMNDPMHPDFRAFHDPSDARHRLVNDKYNRAVGLV